MYVPLTENLVAAESAAPVNVVPKTSRRTLQVIYRLSETARVKIKLINSAGKIKREFDLGPVLEGMHSSKLDVSRIPSGIYSLYILRGKKSKPARQTVILY